MAQKVYKLFMFKGRDVWYQQSQQEKDNLLAKVDKGFEEAEGRRILICNSDWSSEQWPLFGLEEFPNAKAVQKFHVALREFDWFRYYEGFTLLGTPTPKYENLEWKLR